jgi:hypothetical protein
MILFQNPASSVVRTRNSRQAEPEGGFLLAFVELRESHVILPWKLERFRHLP